MSTIVTRAGKGSPLTHNEVDANFTNLNTDKIESGNTVAALNILSANIDGGTIDNTAIGNTTPNTGSFTQVRVNQSWDEGTGRLQVTGQAAIEGNAVAQDVIVQGGNNLVQRSQEFNNAYWTASNTTVTADAAVAPDGTTTAESFIPNTTNGQHYVTRATNTVANITSYTLSIYAKPSGYDWLFLYIATGSATSAYFNLSTGAVGTTSGSPNATITSVGNGWYRCTITHLTSGTNAVIEIHSSITGSTFSYAGNGTSGISIWGAQLELGTVASPYTPTTTAAVTTSNDLLVPSGNVGIGTSSPSARLELRRASPTTLVMSHTDGTGYETTISANYNAAESFSITSNTMKILSCVPNAIGGNGAVVLGSAANVVRVAGSGTLAVGNNDETATPSNGIVRGTNGTGTNIAGATLTLQGGRGTGAAAGGPLVFSTATAGTTGTTLNAATERMRITSAGDVGIGTTSPTTYTGYTSLSINNATNGGLIDLLTNGTRHLTLYAGAGASIIGTQSATDLIFLTNTIERLRINSNGAVFVGNGQLSATPANATIAATGGSGTNITGATLTIQGGRGTGTGAGGPIVFSTSAAGTTGTTLNAATEVMRVTPDQRVGIGTSSPGAALQVVATSLQGIFEGSSQGAIRIKKAGVAGFQLYSDTAGTLGFYDDGSNSTRMYINASGNVGIGTSTPSVKFSVVGGAIATDVAYQFTANASAPTSQAFMYRPASNTIGFGTDSTERVRIDSTGNVGIGTTSPGSALDVKGTLRLSGATSGYVGLAPAAAAGSTTYTLPSADGTNGQALVTNGAGVLSFATVSGGGGAPTTQTYDTGTGATWTKPASANWVTIEMWGGGGSGGCGQNNGAGGGGGGGAYTSYTFKFSDLQGTVTYTVGSGGTSQSTQNAVGNAGGTTSVTLNTFAGGSAKTIYAYGGGGGGYNGAGGGGGGGGGALSAGTSGTNATNGGAGGSPNAGLSSDYGGGTGGSGVASSSDTASNGGNCLYGGGGGGGAQDTTGAGTVGLGGSSIYGGAGGGGGATAGTPGAGGTSTFGGNGGAGAIDANAGTAGTAPGGGGGGTEGGASGAGAAGRVRFTYW